MAMSDVDLRPEEELVPDDDAVIGRAFRMSIVVFVAIAAIVGAVLALSGGDAAGG